MHFEFNKSDITSEAAARLDSLVNAPLSKNIRQITLTGHCDFIGSYAYNDSLSKARIDAVKNYLSGKGIPAEVFVKEMAYGERHPLLRDHSDAARAINRRVELTIEQDAALAKVPDKPTLSQKIEDSATKTGDTLTLENLNFIGGRHVLLPESYHILQELLDALKKNPVVEIEIQGHVCCTGTLEDGLDIDVGTMDLSVQRAKAIFNYLVENGIEERRLRYRGFGGRYKLFPYENDENERSQNRRVEIKILKK